MQESNFVIEVELGLTQEEFVGFKKVSDTTGTAFDKVVRECLAEGLLLNLKKIENIDNDKQDNNQ